MVVRVSIIMSERGWGAKVEDVKSFPTRAEADAFVMDYNKDNNLPKAPGIYWYAQVQE